MQAQVAEADALERTVSGAAGTRSDERPAPPTFEHGVAAEAFATFPGGQASQKVGGCATNEEEDRHPKGNQAANGEVSEEEVLDDAVAQDIELRAQRRGEVLPAGDVAVHGVEGHGGNG